MALFLIGVCGAAGPIALIAEAATVASIHLWFFGGKKGQWKKVKSSSETYMYRKQRETPSSFPHLASKTSMS